MDDQAGRLIQVRKALNAGIESLRLWHEEEMGASPSESCNCLDCAKTLPAMYQALTLVNSMLKELDKGESEDGESGTEERAAATLESVG